MFQRYALRLTIGLLLIALMQLSPHAAAARTNIFDFKVNSIADEVDASPGDGECLSTPSGKCTLRAAIMENNALGGGKRIKVPAGTYALHKDPAEPSEDSGVSGDLDMLGKLTLKGAGRRKTIIDAGQLDRVVDVFNKATIWGVTIKNGVTEGNGGGINVGVDGALTLRNSTVSDNQAANGSGIYGGGKLDIKKSKVAHSLCLKVAQQGGGIYVGYGAHITQSQISRNCADQGGGIFAIDLADVRLDLFVVDSTVDNNRAREGGGIYTYTGGYTLNSTIAYNRANLGSGGSGEGGGIYDASSIEDFAFYNTTVASNTAGSGSTAGGIYVLSFENADLKNTILDYNSPSDCEGPFTSLGYNLIYNDNGCSLSSDPSTQTGIHSELGSLTNNGGPTPTMALNSGSEAIDAIPVKHCTWGTGNGALTTDQRGQPRPTDSDGNGVSKCEIGAFEK